MIKLETTLVPIPAGHRPMIMTLSRTLVLKMVQDQLKAQGDFALPQNAEITFAVPGGGDYSGTDVLLDDDKAVITLRWNT